ncbi:hypothetical protein A0H76_1636 [Hepatospora eriocheir]|uniref:Uncharacterized protein n=1 Tax=Hepatospora eriocheir TaxID=1081669 RepID=A0A1X0QKJ1_9MICR|nr:hypothetical protein A0H76_1636 [Hepatospora eriocheir]
MFVYYSCLLIQLIINLTLSTVVIVYLTKTKLIYILVFAITVTDITSILVIYRYKLLYERQFISYRYTPSLNRIIIKVAFNLLLLTILYYNLMKESNKHKIIVGGIVHFSLLISTLLLIYVKRKSTKRDIRITANRQTFGSVLTDFDKLTKNDIVEVFSMNDTEYRIRNSVGLLSTVDKKNIKLLN